MIDYLKKAIFSKTAKDTSVILVGNALSSLLAVIFTILAARFLGPESWGVVAAVISLVVVIEAIGDLGLGSSLFLFVSRDWSRGEKQKANSVLETIFLLRVVTAFVLLFIFVALADLLDQVILKTNGSLLIILGAISAFAYLLLDFQVMSMQAKHRWVMSAFFNTLSNIARVLLVFILLVINKVTTVSILVVLVLSPLFTFLISLIFHKVRISLKIDWEETRQKIVPFSGWLGVNRFAGSIVSRLDIILLLMFLGEYQTGIFAAAKQLALGIPLVVGSLATVIAPRLASLEESALVLYFKKTILLSFLITIGLGIGILITPEIIWLFGPKYAPSTTILQFLLLGYIPFVLSMPAINLLIYSLGKPQVIGIMSLLQLPAVYLSYLLVIPALGLMGAAVINGLLHLSTMLLSYFFALKYLRAKR